jgi:hypothetical protein
MGLILDCDYRELLTSGFAISTSIGLNFINIFLLLKKKSAILPILSLLVNAILFFFWMFFNVLISLFLAVSIIGVIFCIKRHNLMPRFRTRSGLSLFFLSLMILSLPILVSGILLRIQKIVLPAQNNLNFRTSFCLQYYHNFDLTDEQLSVLKEHGSRIYLSMFEDEFFDDSNATKFAKKLNAFNVEVYALPVLEWVDGVYAADTNVDKWPQMIDRFLAWTNNNTLQFEGVLIDTEPDVQRMYPLQNQIANFDLFGAIANLRGMATSNLHQIAVSKYDDLIADIKSAGFEVMYSAFPMVLDDLGDLDADIQSLMGTPTIPPHDWDYHAYMVYRTVYFETIRMDLGSYLVYSYGRTMQKLFPNNCAMALCCVNIFPYEDSVCKLIDDAFIAKNLGFPEVCLWSYELLVNNFGVEGLEFYLNSLEKDRSVSFDFDPITALLRFGSIMVDLIGIL